MPTSTTLTSASPDDSGTGWNPIASSAWTNGIGSVPFEALRKNSPRTSSAPHAARAWSSTRSQRGRCSGAGRAPRIEPPSVASMFSPSTSR